MRKLRPNLEWTLCLAIFAILAMVTFGSASCDKQKAEDTIRSVIAPLLPLVAESVLNDAKVKAALGEGGEPLAQAALAVMLPLLQNEVTKLASGTEDERLAYRRIQDANPNLAAMIYRHDENGVTHGLWPRLDSWLKLKGYAGASELWRDLTGKTPTILISPDDRDELIDLMGPAIVEEYLAVRDGALHYVLPDFERGE